MKKISHILSYLAYSQVSELKLFPSKAAIDKWKTHLSSRNVTYVVGEENYQQNILNEIGEYISNNLTDVDTISMYYSILAQRKRVTEFYQFVRESIKIINNYGKDTLIIGNEQMPVKCIESLIYLNKYTLIFQLIAVEAGKSVKADVIANIYIYEECG